MAVQIKSFALSQLSLGASCNFHGQIYSLIEAKTPAALHIESFAPRYGQLSGTLAKLVKRLTAYISTEQLVEADGTRDDGAGTILNVVGAFKKSLVAEKKAAALRLSALLAPYKLVRYSEYSKQTSEVNGMLNVLKAPENAAAVTALGLDEEVAALEEANLAFDTIFKQKAAEESERMEVKDLDSDEVVDEANALYAEIVQTVNAYAIVQPTEELEGFIKEVNGFVGVFAKIAEGGASGGGSSSTDRPGNPDEGETPDGGEGSGEGAGEGGDGSGDEGTDLPFEPTDPDKEEDEQPETPPTV